MAKQQEEERRMQTPCPDLEHASGEGTLSGADPRDRLVVSGPGRPKGDTGAAAVMLDAIASVVVDEIIRMRDEECMTLDEIHERLSQE